MKSVETWLDKYAESHRNPVNKTIHWICIPLIMLSIIGLSAAIPAPATSPAFHLGTIGCIAALGYYTILSRRLALGMVVVFGAMLAVVGVLATWSIPLWLTSLVVFVLAWIGQFFGHKIEGKKPSFFEDLQFLLIGPLWLLADLYRRAGLSY